MSETLSAEELEAERSAATARNELAADERRAERLATELWMQTAGDVTQQHISDELARLPSSYTSERLTRLRSLVTEQLDERRQNGRKSIRKRAEPADVMKRPIHMMELPARTRGELRKAEITQVRDLLEWTEENLLAVPYVTEKVLGTIKAYLARHELELAASPSELAAPDPPHVIEPNVIEPKPEAPVPDGEPEPTPDPLLTSLSLSGTWGSFTLRAEQYGLHADVDLTGRLSRRHALAIAEVILEAQDLLQ
jgi:hypothetical protein